MRTLDIEFLFNEALDIETRVQSFDSSDNLLFIVFLHFFLHFLYILQDAIVEVEAEDPLVLINPVEPVIMRKVPSEVFVVVPKIHLCLEVL